jgi:hypothetical protein
MHNGSGVGWGQNNKPLAVEIPLRVMASRDERRGQQVEWREQTVKRKGCQLSQGAESEYYTRGRGGGGIRHDFESNRRITAS